MKIYGHKQWQKYFERLLASGSLGHGYLFYGPAGVGKKTFAVKLAKDLGAKGPPDVQILNPQQKPGALPQGRLKVQAIHELRRELALRPLQSRYKVVIIDQLDNATQQAHNSLLKILEEPQPYRVLIGITEALSRIPETIISRLQLIRFQLLTQQELDAFLEQHTPLSPQDRELVAVLAAGRPARALELAQRLKAEKDFLKKAQKELVYLRQGSLKSRLSFSQELARAPRGRILDKIDEWLILTRAGLRKGEFGRETIDFLEKLGKARVVLSEPGRNVRLCLDELLINLS